MSEISDNSGGNKQISAVEVVFMGVAALVAAPTIPIAILYIYLMLKTNRKENWVLYPSIAVLVILCTKIGAFFTETAHIAGTLVKGLINGHFAISAYGQYSISSWVILGALSLAVASYAVKRIRYNRNREEAGIKTLERQYWKHERRACYAQMC